ncbi:hypothetical protein GXP67_12820 [Rhodocytophaga rosea]|uniref:DUF4097 domain-containing protein n=1 Tax=Rhodocytophaga rosea TaxID=2704465 RepID=A0A6C0GHH1_9BACT|nr:DUF4097 family beta strand repeat-containing protein [Rhodocytophaga rosea]QHT67448.1 hypothetical protein GXP67_12820 [Rhodocytophaga rosea]
MKMKLICLVLAFFRQLAIAQEDKENIVKELSFPRLSEASVLYVENINGSVSVEGYNGDKVMVEVEKTLKASTNEDLQKAKNEVKLGIEQSGDSLTLYVDNPYVYRRKDGKLRYDFHGNWNEDYNYVFNFKIRVPNQVKLAVYTINKGNINVSNTRNNVNAGNVNGSITLEKIAGTTKATTVNGDVKAAYTALPPSNSSYKTLNGNIEVSYPENLSAELKFKTTNGEAYTDFTVAEMIASKVEKTSDGKARGVSYKIEGHSGVRIGKGGMQHSFEVFNGDITVKKAK